MRRKAFGAIGMLLAMVIIAIMFILMMPALKNTGTAGMDENSIDTQSVEKRVNEQVEDIEKIRQQTININQNISQEY